MIDGFIYGFLTVPGVLRTYHFVPQPLKNFFRPVLGYDDPPEIQRIMARYSGSVAVDAGAFDGKTTQKLLKRFHIVVAFEPSYQLSLERLSQKYPGRVLLQRKALAATSGYVVEYMRNGQFRDDKPSGSWGYEGVPRTLSATTLDEFFYGLLPPDFVKIDVEGYEVDVLDGARLLMVRGTKTVWFIEVHHEKNGDEVRKRFAHAHIEQFRHPSYKPGSSNWYNHFWLVVTP